MSELTIASIVAVPRGGRVGWRNALADAHTHARCTAPPHTHPGFWRAFDWRWGQRLDSVAFYPFRDGNRRGDQDYILEMDQALAAHRYYMMIRWASALPGATPLVMQSPLAIALLCRANNAAPVTIEIPEGHEPAVVARALRAVS